MIDAIDNAPYPINCKTTDWIINPIINPNSVNKYNKIETIEKHKFFLSTLFTSYYNKIMVYSRRIRYFFTVFVK